MLLPTTATAVLVALIIGLIGWGSWASLYKAAKKLRFEFFAYDFMLGAAIAAAVAAFTLGSWNSAELTFQDNFLLAGMRKMAWAGASGLAFAFANILLLAAVAVSGMSVAFPIAFGIAWAIGSILTFVYQQNVNAMLAFGGAGVSVVAALMAMVTYRLHLVHRAAESTEALRADPRAKTAPPPPDMGLKGFLLALLSGVLFASFFPMIQEATRDENGLSGYGATLVLVGGNFPATIVLIPIFLNFPVKGKPLTVAQYFKVVPTQHFWGLLAGVVWVAGLLGNLVVVGSTGLAGLEPVAVYMLQHGAPLLAALWGLLVWRELKGAPARVNALAWSMVVLLAIGMVMIGVAPLYGN